MKFKCLLGVMVTG